MTIRLLVGLGNPGDKYQQHRHNAGFIFLDYIAQQFNVTFKENKGFNGQFAQITVTGQTVYLFKPQTFMNHSGRAVLAISQFFNIQSDEILIAHDEIDLPSSSVRLKFSGGHGGHNGLRDITQQLSSTDFYRLRLGVGRPDTLMSVSDFVLENFTQAQLQLLRQHLVNIFMLFEQIITQKDLEQVMQQLHT